MSMLPPRQRQARPDSEQVMAVTGIMPAALTDHGCAGKGSAATAHILLQTVRFIIAVTQFD